MTLVPLNVSKEIMKKYKELWSKIRDLMKSITKNSNDYNEKYMKIKFYLDNLPLDKTLEICYMIKVAFSWKQQYHPQVFFRWMFI